MKARNVVLGAGALLLGASPFVLPPVVGSLSPVPDQALEAGLGDARSLERSYRRWAADYAGRGGDRTLALSLGYSKALSSGFTAGHGLAEVDLMTGSVSVEVEGLPTDDALDVWLVDNRDGVDSSVMPEAEDALLRLGPVSWTNGRGFLETRLDSGHLRDFELDLMVIARAGEEPGTAGLLFGSPSLFQRLYYNERQGWYADTSEEVAAEGAPFGFLVPRPAFAQTATVDLERLVRRGERLFFNETFEGNGRTCGTCHPRENNFTIDPAFIARLPDRDPLFVAEFNPDLAELERPKLMREFGLILENLDGFEPDPTEKFVMRGVPHTLAMPNSLTPSQNDGTTIPPNQRTGWSGDGAPGSGTLRDFATGAVTQHFTRDLRRIPGKHFRLPTERELDAMEAFQLSLGRQEELALNDIVMLDERVDLGRRIFLNRLINNNMDPQDPTIGVGQCNRCHANGGANVGGGTNNNFNTGVEKLAVGQSSADIPCDGGFGVEPHPEPDLICGPNNFGQPAFGNGTFNSVTVVEAADTGPFFHNNAVATIEQAVAFYSGPEFNGSPNGMGIGGIALAEEETLAVAAFLRVINAAENIRSAVAFEKRSLETDVLRLGAIKTLLRQAIAENRDGIVVLRERALHPDAVRHLRSAHELLRKAIVTTDYDLRHRLVKRAVVEQLNARDLMVRSLSGDLG